MDESRLFLKRSVHSWLFWILESESNVTEWLGDVADALTMPVQFRGGGRPVDPNSAVQRKLKRKRKEGTDEGGHSVMSASVEEEETALASLISTFTSNVEEPCMDDAEVRKACKRASRRRDDSFVSSMLTAGATRRQLMNAGVGRDVVMKGWKEWVTILPLVTNDSEERGDVLVEYDSMPSTADHEVRSTLPSYPNSSQETVAETPCDMEEWKTRFMRKLAEEGVKSVAEASIPATLLSKPDGCPGKRDVAVHLRPWSRHLGDVSRPSGPITMSPTKPEIARGPASGSTTSWTR